MTAPVFRLDPLPDGPVDRLELTGPEGRHAATVRRLDVGERVDVTDGRGRLAECEVRGVARDELDLAVLRWVTTPAPDPRLVVVQAIAKGDRGELAVEVLTEVGVDEVVPWAAARSVVKWQGPRGERALERWRSTAREAAKQSRRSWWPVVAAPATTADVVARLAAAALPVVLHESADRPMPVVGPAGAAGPARPAGAAGPAGGDVVLVVGPEGGLTDAELTAFGGVGAEPYRLGPTVLRTSTAGVVAAAVLLAASGRWA